jgi:hypothetical protein
MEDNLGGGGDLEGDFWGDLGGDANLKTHFKKIMLTLSLYCHMFSVGM